MSPEGNTSKHLKLRRVKSNAGHKMTPFYGQVLQNVEFKSILPSLRLRVKSDSRARAGVAAGVIHAGLCIANLVISPPSIPFD